METSVEPRALRRLAFVAWIGVLWGLLLFGRLVQYHILDSEALAKNARQQQERIVEVQAVRGTIFSGGEGGGPLAISVPVRRVVMNPMRVTEESAPFVAMVIEQILGTPAKALEADIKASRAASRGYLILREDATEAEIARLRASKLDIFTFEHTYRREYPKGALASHVLGWVNFEGHGDAGIERGLEDELAGTPGRVHLLRDARGREYQREVLNEERAEPGWNITLTIDEAIQHAAETALKAAVEKEGVPSGTVVVLNPKTGDILAMASYPSFDPRAKVKNENDMLERLNLTIGAPFEPGSVFKAVTVGAALETTRIRPETIINCGNGLIRLPGRVVHDHNSYSALPVSMVLAKSSNVGAINIGLAVGNKRMHEYMTRFGFGQRIGIPLPGESGGRVHPVRDWTPGSMGSVAMGHEVSATPLQMAQAFGIIANNGQLVKPRLVKLRKHPLTGQTIESPIAAAEQRLKPETAISLRRMLEQVVLEGTGKSARLKSGYTVAGKTGTAQMVDPATGRYLHRYNSSFVGFAPVADPAIVVAVTINGSYRYGGESAAPVFREVTGAALRTLGIRKDLIEEEPPVKPEAIEAPAPPVVQQLASEPKLDSESQADPAQVSGPVAPDFQGMTVRAVLARSLAEGWQVEAVGRGIAREQKPAAGAAVGSGRRIRVLFRQ